MFLGMQESMSACKHASLYVRAQAFCCVCRQSAHDEHKAGYQYEMMIIVRRDSTLDTLLDLNGQVFVINEMGYWVKFVVRQVPMTTDKPHGLDYSLTMHSPDGGRLVGFDNAHQVARQGRGAAHDHKHRLRTVRPYDYSDAGALLEAFWKEVDSVLHEKGI